MYRFKIRETEHDGMLFRVLKIILVESSSEMAADVAISTVNYDHMLISKIDSSSNNQDSVLTQKDRLPNGALSSISDLYTAHSLPH